MNNLKMISISETFNDETGEVVEYHVATNFDSDFDDAWEQSLADAEAYAEEIKSTHTDAKIC